MVLNYQEEIQLEDAKHLHRMEFEKLRHENAVIELSIQLDIARAGGEIR
jgi:hypothetical protein